MKNVRSAMNYERTGQVKSKRKDVEQTIFRDMTIGTMFMALGHELWRRYSCDILTVLVFTQFAIIIWIKLG